MGGQFGHCFPGSLNSGLQLEQACFACGSSTVPSRETIEKLIFSGLQLHPPRLPNTPLNTPQQHSQQPSDVHISLTASPNSPPNSSPLTGVSTRLHPLPPSRACPNQRLHCGYGSSFARDVVECGATSGAEYPSCNPPSPKGTPTLVLGWGTEWRAAQGGRPLVHIAA